MYNLTQIVLKNGNELGVVALVDIQKDTEPFKLSNMEKSTRDKRKQRDELSEDERDFIQILDFERQELEVKMAMAKGDFEYWEGRIQETIAKKKNIFGGG